MQPGAAAGLVGNAPHRAKDESAGGGALKHRVRWGPKLGGAECRILPAMFELLSDLVELRCEIFLIMVIRGGLVALKRQSAR